MNKRVFTLGMISGLLVIELFSARLVRGTARDLITSSHYVLPGIRDSTMTIHHLPVIWGGR